MSAVLRYRYLFQQLVRRELRQRYRGSVLGLLWYLVNPLVLMGAYWLMFGHLLKAVSEEDYPLFLMVGLIVWLFFSQSVMSSAAAFIANGSLIGKVRFPRQTIPASVVSVQFVTFGVLLLLLMPIMVAVRGTFRPALLLLPFILLCLFGFVLGFSLMIAVLHAYYRDIEPILGAALLPWFFLSPIFFQPGHLPGVEGSEWARIALTWLNPVAPFIDATRSVLYAGVSPSLTTLAYIALAASMLLGCGNLLFRRMERELAVVV